MPGNKWPENKKSESQHSRNHAPGNANLFAVFQAGFPARDDAVLVRDNDGATITYGDMVRDSARMANYFLSLGLRKGDRIAVQVEKSTTALMVYLGAVRAGLIYLPLNTGYTDSELSYFFGDAAPSLVIGDPARLDALRRLLPDADVPVASLAADGSGSLVSAAREHATEFTTVHCQDDDLAAILYTSGTTGRPKGAMLSHGNLVANALTLRQLWGFTPQDVLLHALPLFHVHGLFVACHCVLAAGASMIFLPKLQIDALKTHLPASTVLMGVPTFYTRLLADADFDTRYCRNMRLFISGSAPLLESTHREFERRTGHRILERYGMSETGMLVSNPLVGERRAGTVGLPLPDVTVRIVDGDDHPVAPGAVGSIQVRGPNVFQGYWQMPEKTAQEFTRDGFFITGDLGMVSEDGYIAIVGRAKDLVISGGYNVYPKEVEAVIDRIEGVRESAVIGIADPDLGEKVIAVIVADGSRALTPELVQDLVREQLAAYKLPRRVEFVDELPRNTMGKVQKNRLRELYSA